MYANNKAIFLCDDPKLCGIKTTECVHDIYKNRNKKSLKC